MITQWKNSEETLKTITPKLPTYIQKFITHNSSQMKATTLLDYAKDIQQFLEWLLMCDYAKAENISDIEINVLENLYRDDLEDYRLYLKSSENQHGEKFKDSTLNRKFSALKSMYNFLQVNERYGTRETYITRNPMSQVTLIKDTYSSDERISNIQKGILVNEEIKLFRKFIKEDFGELVKGNKRIYGRWIYNKERDLAIVSLILGSGLRISEVVDIKMSDVDFKSREVLVYRKSGKKRNADFSATASNNILDYLKVREERYPGDSEYLFVTKYKGTNKQMTKRAMQEMISKYAEYFKKPQLTAHKLRHSFATNHLAVNNNLRALQLILDHASGETTNLYAHIFDSELHETVDKADKE